MFDTGPSRRPPMMGGMGIGNPMMGSGMLPNPGNLDRGPNFGAKPSLSNFYGETNPMNRINGMGSNIKPIVQGPSNNPMDRISGMGMNRPNVQIGQGNPSQFGNRMGGGMGMGSQNNMSNFWQTFMQQLMQNQGGGGMSHTM